MKAHIFALAFACAGLLGADAFAQSAVSAPRITAPPTPTEESAPSCAEDPACAEALAQRLRALEETARATEESEAQARRAAPSPTSAAERPGAIDRLPRCPNAADPRCPTGDPATSSRPQPQ